MTATSDPECGAGALRRPLVDRTRRAVLPLVVLLAMAGCGGPAGPAVAVLDVGVAVRDPIWSDGAVFALAEDGSRVARIDPGGSVVVSPELPRAGGNLVPGPLPDETVLVAQPDVGRVEVLAAGDLRPVSTIPTGAQPADIDVVVEAKVLLALSADGSTVSAVDLDRMAPLPDQQVGAAPGAGLDAPNRGRRVSFFVAGPTGIDYYEGAPGDAVRRAQSPVRAAVSTGDLVKVSRLYVAEAGTDRLVAVEATPDEDRLVVTGTLDAGGPVEHIGVDPDRVYALTRDRLTVARTSNYEGFADGRFSVITTVDLRAALPPELRDTPFTGLAVGSDRIWVAVAGEPVLIAVAKPAL